MEQQRWLDWEELPNDISNEKGTRGDGEPPREAEKPRPAPPRFDQPKNDNERLLNCQWEYLEKGDQKALDEMYSLGYTIALKYIGTAAKKNKKVARLSDDDKAEKAHNAISYIIVRYLRRRDFCITDSFTAYLYLRIQHELFYRRKVDKIVAFVDMDNFLKKGGGK